jgi:large subunit ribosomal protein L4
MPTGLLTPEAAQSASLRLVEEGKGQQALHQTLVAYRNNRRAGTAHTKRRGEVRGSGKKLWNQKGTGNARMGSRRSPIWSGGATVFGPRTRDFSQKVNKQTKSLAFRVALTARINDGDVVQVPSVQIADGKTKSFATLISKVTDARKVLVVLGEVDANTYRSSRNLPHVFVRLAKDINAEDLLNCQKVILSNGALEVLSQRTA